MEVIKRSGKVVPYDVNRIRNAVLKCGKGAKISDPESLAKLVTQDLEDWITRQESTVSVEDIQDQVERALMSYDSDAAKHYILYRDERAELRAKRLTPDFNALADYVQRAKYARYSPEKQRRESWDEIVDRIIGLHREKYPFLPEDLFDFIEQQMKEKRVLPSMRFSQFAGPALARDNARGYNCTFSHFDRPEFVKEVLFLLLCGCGAAYSVQKKHIAKLPSLVQINRQKVVHCTIADTKEGWADAAYELFKSYIEGYYVEFNYSKIRPAGAPLKTSGGRAPGHLGLRDALETCRGILHQAQGRRLRPFEAHLLVCTLADAVLSGGVRRSACLVLFSPDDDEMLSCKTGEWWTKYPQLRNSNNSMASLRSEFKREDLDRVGKALRNFGEPGFYITEDLDYGINPCAEANFFPLFQFDADDVETNALISRHTGLSLRQLKGLHGKSGWQMCNLTSINGVAAKTKEEFLLACRAAAILGTLQAGYCKFPYLGKTTEAIVIREALLGVSMTGILLNPDICLNPEILEEGAKLVVETNKELAAKIGIPQASRTTMVKPEGTGSLILHDKRWGEVSAGCSPVPAKRYIRRVTAKITEPLFQYFRQHNPHMIEQESDTKFYICFPIESAATVTKQNLDPVTHLDYIVTLQKHWVLPGTARPERSPGLTHSVSNTVFVGPDEWDAALNAVWDNRNILVGATMYAKGAEGGHQFLPEEPVLTAADEERWNALIRDYVPVPWEECLETEDSTILQQELACAGGACSIV